MHSPPELERNEQFLVLADVFKHNGVPVPEIVATDRTRGFFLLTDLGGIHLDSLYGTPAQSNALQAAINMLPRIAATQHPSIEPYTRERLHMELDIFSEWFAQELLNQPLDLSLYAEMCGVLVASADLQPKGCVHRDYHCRNLLFTNQQLGIVDFQDALYGPILYDIASLLRDCYHEFSEPEVDQGLRDFVAITPKLANTDPDQIKTWFDLMAIQRQLKAVGIIARLHLRDAKSSHMQYIMPVLNRLHALAAGYPQLRPLTEQLDGCIKVAQPILTELT
jgi:aminoglycoside/choline kinase family phosphotransferase